jgi:hypothetical protein
MPNHWISDKRSEGNFQCRPNATKIGAVSIGVTGGFLGHRFGKKAGVIVDKNVFLDYKCLKCGTKFKEQHLTPAQ